LVISTSVYIVGYASATKFYGDGSGLYNVVASSLTSGNYLNEVMVSSAVYAEVLGGKTSDYFAVKSEVADSTMTLSQQILSVAVSTGTLVTLSSTQTITAAKTFTSSVVVQNIFDVYELKVTTINVAVITSTSPATTPLVISTSVYIVGYASATKFYGDGSGLYNVVASSLTSGNYLNEVMVSSAVYAEVLGGKTSDYFAIKSEVANSTMTLSQQILSVAESTGTLVTLSSTQTITAAKTFTSSVVVQNIFDVYELKVTTINASDTTPYGGITITSNVFVDIGNVGIGTMQPQASLHVVSTDTISTILKLQTREISETVVVVSTSGNLGVGTENPEAKLDIQQTDTTQAYSVKIGTSPTSYHLVVSTTGNVGIGKMPSQELEGSGKSGNVEAASCILRPDSYKVGIDTPPVSGMLIFYNSDVYVSTGTTNAWDWKKLQWTNP
jgi:hypothetical protein